jgi:hypothetical protein
MMTRSRNALAALPLAVLIALAAPACAPLSAMDDVIGSTANSRGNTLYGEIRSVDTRGGRITVREQRGRDYTVRIDNRTQVVYGQRRYPVSSLRRGDMVQMRVAYDRDNRAWAERIEVRRSQARGRDDRSDRDREYGSVQRFDGTVRQVDTRRGVFTLDRGRGASLVVYVTRNTDRDDVRRFERLRRNERVRVEVRVRGNSNQAELVRFR